MPAVRAAMSRKEEDLREVMRAERRRGARRNAVSRQKMRELQGQLARLLELDSEKDFRKALIESFGISEDSQEFADALRVWRDLH